jgi:two-component system cell cycle sensor histidine kinase/response regulator CckA
MMMRNKFRQNDRLLLEQVNQLYEQSHIASLGAVTASIVTGFILWPMVPRVHLSIWVLAAIGITVIRQIFIFRYRRAAISARDAPRWLKLFIRLIFISGVIWGSSAVFILPVTSFAHQVFLSFILVAMVSGAIGTFSAILPVFLAYALPALIPLCIVFWIAGTPIQQAMGAMVLIYLGLVSISAYHLFRTTRTSLKLQFENIDLIHFLEEEKHRADTINKNLKDEVKERKRIEDILKKHRENLENVIEERTAALKKSNTNLKIEISERRKTENALKESEEKYRLLVENANDAILVFQEGVSKFHNKRTESLLACTTRDLYEIPLAELCHVDKPDFWDPDFLKNLPRHSPAVQEKENIASGNIRKVINKKNKVLWVHISAIPVNWENAPAMLCFLRDITQQKHLEAELFQARKIEAIGTMAAGIAHDFNNILSGIQGNTSLALLNITPDHAIHKRLTDIETYIAGGTELTRQLLDFASPKHYDRQPIDINQLLKDTAAIFCRTKKELRLHIDCRNRNRVVEADKGQIQQAFTNLLVNAWQAMPGGGDLRITTKDVTISETDNISYKTSPGEYIKISIADSGIGMSPALLSKIFDPFFTTKKRGKGTGLGLSSVYGTIESHNGHINVKSRVGRGTVFHIYLPIAHRPTSHLTPPDDDIVTGTETILIIDDEPDILAIGQEILEAIGYRVYSAPGASRAIEIYSTYRDRIDLIILDMIMPEMNGEQVYDRLAKINPDVKVLLSSGYSQAGQAERILKKGCNGFIQKPFKIQQLSQIIRKILHPD